MEAGSVSGMNGDLTFKESYPDLFMIARNIDAWVVDYMNPSNGGIHRIPFFLFSSSFINS